MLEIFWLCFSFIFLLGCCIGSFLNVVIYRLPRNKSIVVNPSACPSCSQKIRFYDNIPVLSWFILAGKCRNCKAKITPRYFIVELLTGILFAATFYIYFNTATISDLPKFEQGGWLIYLLHIIMISAFLAASAIDLELWVIPISICWFVTAAALIASALAYKVINPVALINQHSLLPTASSATAALAAGAIIGLIISLVLLYTEIIKPSYASENDQDPDQISAPQQEDDESENYNDRLEMLKEILFLAPIIICAIAAFYLTKNIQPLKFWWGDFSQHPAISGLLGAAWGYFIGCAIVWATRIFGTLAFGKEAMGLGDVHLMGAAGAVLGPLFVVVAFFIAPFCGLLWAAVQMFFKKIRQIPYGPFLSLGVFAVIILHDRILTYWNTIIFP